MSPPYNYHTTGTEVASDLSSAIRGKTILTTGITPNSLGHQFVTTIAAHSPALLILASRTQSTLDATCAALAASHPTLPTRPLLLDLNSLASVRAAADTVTAWQRTEGLTIDVLMLNAGIMACPYATTADGFERQFGTNHLGHFVFANRIIPGMLASSKSPRVVVVSSEGHRLSPIRFADPGFQGGSRYDRWRAYGQAKTANCLYAWALAERLGGRGLQAYSLHPGAILTNLGRDVDILGEDWEGLLTAFSNLGNPQGFPEHWEKNPLKTLDEGTATHVVAAFADGLEKQNGQFLRDSQIASWDMVSPWARDSYDAARLWKLSEELVGEKFDF